MDQLTTASLKLRSNPKLVSNSSNWSFVFSGNFGIFSSFGPWFNEDSRSLFFTSPSFATEAELVLLRFLDDLEESDSDEEERVSTRLWLFLGDFRLLFLFLDDRWLESSDLEESDSDDELREALFLFCFLRMYSWISEIFLLISVLSSSILATLSSRLLSHIAQNARRVPDWSPNIWSRCRISDGYP